MKCKKFFKEEKLNLVKKFLMSAMVMLLLVTAGCDENNNPPPENNNPPKIQKGRKKLCKLNSIIPMMPE